MELFRYFDNNKIERTTSLESLLNFIVGVESVNTIIRDLLVVKKKKNNYDINKLLTSMKN